MSYKQIQVTPPKNEILIEPSEEGLAIIEVGRFSGKEFFIYIKKEDIQKLIKSLSDTLKNWESL